MTMQQEAPMPAALFDLVATVKYKPGWAVDVVDLDRGQGSKGLTLRILTRTEDSYHPGEVMRVNHYFIVPAAAYDARSWRRWLFDRFVDVETHEVMEFFQAGGERPYAPSHGPGNDPYMVREVGTELDQRTSFRGEVHEA